MADLESVIFRLENWGKKCPWQNCAFCGESNRCMNPTIRDALTLLKNQEARVMTLEEARETLHTAEFLYCEDRNDDTREGGLLRGVLNGSGYWDLINGEYMTLDCLDEGEDLESEYGKTFRFWTAKPSPEQMRETSWKEEKE